MSYWHSASLAVSQSLVQVLSLAISLSILSLHLTHVTPQRVARKSPCVRTLLWGSKTAKEVKAKEPSVEECSSCCHWLFIFLRYTKRTKQTTVDRSFRRIFRKNWLWIVCEMKRCKSLSGLTKDKISFSTMT